MSKKKIKEQLKEVQISACWNCQTDFDHANIPDCPNCGEHSYFDHVFNPAEDVMYIEGKKVNFHTHPDCPVTDCFSAKGENGCICEFVL
jgi:hypothetical protein